MLKNIKIGVAIMVNNMEEVIPACISSLHWVDAIYILNDHCTDKSIALAKEFAKTKLIIEKSPFNKTAFEHSELKTRNYIIKKAFECLKSDVLILLDADEMLSDIIKPAILSAFSADKFDRIALNIWHLYTHKEYIHLWETCINNITMVDPHIRIIKKGVEYKTRFSDGSHPGIKFTKSTLCLNGAYHFHLKYLEKLNYPNYSFHFLPKFFNRREVSPFLRKINFSLPQDIKESLTLIQRNKNTKKKLKHHQERRTVLKDINSILIHPRDKKQHS
jgi:hypothetical protein